MRFHIHAAKDIRAAADPPFDWPINQTTGWFLAMRNDGIFRLTTDRLPRPLVMFVKRGNPACHLAARPEMQQELRSINAR